MFSKRPLLTLLLLSAFSIFLPACTRSASLTQNPTGHASPAPTSHSTPTDTVDPSEVASPTRTLPLPATSTPGETKPSPSPTPDLSLYNRQASVSDSPGGRYQARVVVSFPETSTGDPIGDQYHSLVEVTDLISDRTINLLDQWQDTGLGLTTPRILGWGNQEEALYIADTGVPDGCGPPFTENVRQVDPQSGEITILELNMRGPWAFSPQGEAIAYIQKAEFVVYDLDSHRERRISFTPPDQDWWATSLVWSPDGGMALLSITTGACGPPENRQGWIVKVNTTDETIQDLLMDDPRDFTLLNWPLEGYAQLSDPQGTIWWTDTLSGEVAQAPPSQVAQAQDALVSFFDSLNQGRYAEVERWFGGSYEILLGYNPGINPNDHAALWRAACEFNGFQCLQVNQAILQGQPSPESYRFLVSFISPEGELFVRGPCCGADETEMPPEWEFPFTVERSQTGEYRVVDLPVYVP